MSLLSLKPRLASIARHSTARLSSSLAGRTLMVANRGEIACRVFRTANSLGMNTVSVHSEADGMAQHVKQSQQTVCIGPAPSIQSYLVIDNILKAMKETGTEFVHPGYGFLSENAAFSDACAANGIKFVGPGKKAIDAMGDKIMSKQIAIDAGINTIPGFQGVIKDDEEAVKISNEVGYPVMIKASAGGGGKGMRIAWNDAEAREGFRLSTDEAKASFDDDRIFIEKFIERPHHIEIQLLADGPEHDNVVCFPERECSIQRRNQKVIEESPSTLLTVETRREMARQAAQLARAVDYCSAGTVEFLCDEKQNFYFLEMNTRLQVEHPVTEMVSGVDLVKHMIEVADGLPLPADLVKAASEQEAGVVPYKGWAIESRIYAEDPFRGFLPSTGPLSSYREPATETNLEGVTVRVDSGVVEGSNISMYYDPMISKLVTYAESRDLAIEGMTKAIDEYIIRGVGHNTPFVADVCRHQHFKDGDTPTSFIETHYPDGFTGVKLDEHENHCLAASLACVSACRTRMLNSPPLAMAEPRDEEDDYLDFEYGDEEEEAEPTESCVVVIGGSHGTPYKVGFNMWGGPTTVQRLGVKGGEDGEIMELDVGSVVYDPADPFARIEINDESKTIQIHGESKENTLTVQMSGAVTDVVVRSEKEHELAKLMLEPPVLDTSSMVLSPMPGKLVSYAVEEGDAVELGQELCVVEAMKMQNILRADKKGVVKRINYKMGDSLKVDAVLIEFEEVE